MELIGTRLLQSFKNQYPDVKDQIDAWTREVERAEWRTPHDVKNSYPKASLIGNSLVVFNIRGKQI